jgi:hypothetical protein
LAAARRRRIRNTRWVVGCDLLQYDLHRDEINPVIGEGIELNCTYTNCHLECGHILVRRGRCTRPARALRDSAKAWAVGSSMDSHRIPRRLVRSYTHFLASSAGVCFDVHSPASEDGCCKPMRHRPRAPTEIVEGKCSELAVSGCSTRPLPCCRDRPAHNRPRHTVCHAKIVATVSN